MANAVLEPIDLSLPSMKELGAKWLTGMAEYLAANPQFMVNGLIRSGVTHALDHNDDTNVVESPIINVTESAKTGLICTKYSYCIYLFFCVGYTISKFY